MNTEEKELLLKDLCARLPYGVHIHYVAANESFIPTVYSDELAGLENDLNHQNAQTFRVSSGGFRELNEHELPILFPIECLTKPITIASYNEGKSFVPIIEMAKISVGDKNFIVTKHGDPMVEGDASVVFGFNVIDGSFFIDGTSSNYIPNQLKLFEFMDKYMINYRLPAHLFVPVTETFNPYVK